MKTYRSPVADVMHRIPLPLIIAVLYITCGVLFHIWHPGWVMFLAIPFWYALADSFEQRRFAPSFVPLLIIVVFLVLGFAFDLWHPGWLVFLLIPVWEAFLHNFGRGRKDGRGDGNDGNPSDK